LDYTPHSEQDIRAMLDAIGLASIDELFAEIDPELLKCDPLGLPAALTEQEALARMVSLAARNVSADTGGLCFLGGGCADHHVPAVIAALVGRGEFLTAYTPYQPEISQGTLQAIYEYQQLVCRLTEMDLANASMYDGATALAEAIIICCELAQRKVCLLPETVSPLYWRVAATYVGGLGIELRSIPMLDGVGDPGAASLDGVGCVVVQSPNSFGCIEDVGAYCDLARANGALSIVVFDPISLGLLKPPGAYGADFAVGEGQSVGLAMSFGGPYLGMFAAKAQYARSMPGRIAAKTTDTKGRTGYVLALQTREQHIKRERATSNICTNQAICALSSAIYLALMGPDGMRKLGEVIAQRAHYAADRIAALDGFESAFPAPFFKEFVVKTTRSVSAIQSVLADNGILGALDLSRWYPELRGHVSFCITEKHTKEDIDKLVSILGKV
jgi:glycine dehydrogenase subunit 1